MVLTDLAWRFVKVTDEEVRERLFQLEVARFTAQARLVQPYVGQLVEAIGQPGTDGMVVSPTQWGLRELEELQRQRVRVRVQEMRERQARGR